MGGYTKKEHCIDKSNIRFYNAFESLAIEGMEEVWKHSDDVVCVHPGWDLFTGWMAIRESWVTIFQNTDRIQFHITNTKIRIFEKIAIVICLENIRTIVNESKIRMGIVATNIFERQNNNSEEKWLMIHHHGSVVSNYVPPNVSSTSKIEVANTGQQESIPTTAAEPEELQKRLNEANNKIKELQLQTKPVPVAVHDVQKNLVIPLG